MRRFPSSVRPPANRAWGRPSGADPRRVAAASRLPPKDRGTRRRSLRVHPRSPGRPPTGLGCHRGGGVIVLPVQGWYGSGVIHAQGQISNGLLGGGVGLGGPGHGSAPLHDNQPLTTMSCASASASSGKSPTWSAGQTTVPSSPGTTTPSKVMTSAFPNVSAKSSVTGAESGAPSDSATSGVAQTATPGTPTISPTTVGQPSARRHCGPWWLPARERTSRRRRLRFALVRPIAPPSARPATGEG